MVGGWDESSGYGVDGFVDAYEEAQARAGQADLAAFLPPTDHPLYPAVLCELIRVDLEYGFERGQPRPLAEYQSEFPELSRHPELVEQVAFEERRLRRQAESEAKAEATPRPFVDQVSTRFRPRNAALEDGRGRWFSQTVISQTFASGLRATNIGEGSDTLLKTLRDADPGTAEKVEDALRMLPEPGSDFAGFRLIRELGRGAFGRVYLARQGDLADRPVALKVSADVLGEPQTLAQLQHTHVVPIYSAHQVGGLRAVCMPYFGATTLVDVLHGLRARSAPPESGAAIVDSLSSLSAAASAATSAADQDPEPGAPAAVPASPGSTASLETLRRLSYVPAVLWIGVRLADGLAHAHERGIIHRDLKPANVLLTDDGQPMLLDFNLAADTKRGAGAAAALVGGTLPYMAPEALEALRAARGEASADARGDLYALGVILYELLGGRHPFPIHRGPLEEVLPRMIADRQSPPRRLRVENPAVTPATESIILRCLEPDPARRYREARQLQEDLQRQLDDRPLRHAPEPSLRERASKWSRRHPRLAVAGVAALLIAALVAGYSIRQRRFGPLEAALAFRELAEAHESARVHLLDPADLPALREEGIASCRKALERYGVNLNDPQAWRRSPLVTNLSDGERAEVRARLGELLMLWARALARQAAGEAPGRRAELIRAALEHNRLAGLCFGPGEAPRVLRDQRADLAQLGGDRVEAQRARAEAKAMPLRSLRDYALLFLDDPTRAASVQAAAALSEASRRQPQDFGLWMNLGQCQAIQGRLVEAEDSFTIAVALRPQSPWPYFHRGRVALERREFPQARLDFDEVLRLRAGLVPALINRALARLGQGDHAGAIADLDEARDRGALETRIDFIRAEAYTRSGATEEARRARAEGLRRTPVDAESWVARGLARLPGDPTGALDDFEHALGLDPASRPALQNKASVLAGSLGRTEEAIAVLDRLVALCPDFAPARVGRGVLHARLGHRRDALRDAEEARRRDASGETTYRLACIYALTSKWDPADRSPALRLLATALGQGGRWYEVARTDPDLDALRDQEAFRNVLRAFADPPESGG
jgi:serine/threonine protein kinase/tetratricopeptide (TPR) repeat protein